MADDLTIKFRCANNGAESDSVPFFLFSAVSRTYKISALFIVDSVSFENLPVPLRGKRPRDYRAKRHELERFAPRKSHFAKKRKLSSRVRRLMKSVCLVSQMEMISRESDYHGYRRFADVRRFVRIKKKKKKKKLHRQIIL